MIYVRSSPYLNNCWGNGANSAQYPSHECRAGLSVTEAVLVQRSELSNATNGVFVWWPTYLFHPHGGGGGASSMHPQFRTGRRV
jgi:hypothetical protein